MKRWSTTPVSKGLATKSLIVATVVVMAVAGPIAMMPRANADKYDDQIRAIQSEIDQYEAQTNKLVKQSQTLSNRLSQIATEKSAIQAKINLSQAKYDKLKKQIKETEQKIDDNQDALGTTLADLYVDGSISPLEMLASSKNIGDYVDKQTYQSSVRDALTDTIETIERLKNELNDQKVAVEKVLEKQKLEKGALVAKENEQQALLAETKGKEANYRSMISSARSQLQKVAAQQQAAIARLTNNGRNTSGAVGSFEFRNLTPNQPCGAGGYPYCGAQDSYADPWALYNRECVSYAAWAASERFGKHVESFNGAGHAYQWPSTVLRMGANVNNTPAVGSIAITPQQPYTPLGHAMVVEEVYGDGWVRVSQYNFAGTGMYSTMDLKVSSAVYVHFK